MRELKPKPYKVTDPSGKVHLAYAKTQMGAIGDVCPEGGAVSAVISECGRYRYQLQRPATVAKPSAVSAVFCMLNPSTADAEIDDPTIRRCRGFADRWDCAGLVVVNLYALRATDPRELWRAGYAVAVGPENDDWLRDAASGARDVICAWGANADIERVRQAVAIFRGAGARLWCLGATKDGHPRHPLYIRGNTKPVEWTPPFGEVKP